MSGEGSVDSGARSGGKNSVPKIRNVELLGHFGKVKFTQDQTGFQAQMPEQKPSDQAITLKIALV